MWQLKQRFLKLGLSIEHNLKIGTLAFALGQKVCKTLSNFQNFDWFDVHNFFVKKLVIESYKGRLSLTCCFDLTYGIRFGRIVDKKIPKNRQLKKN